MASTNLALAKKTSDSFISAQVLSWHLLDEKRAYDLKESRKRQDVIAWMKGHCPEARYFLTLTFSYEPTREQAEKAAKVFRHEVSRAIAGKRATTHGRYSHPMAIILEQQALGRWHLHVMMAALPAEYERIIYVDDLKMKCAEIWNKRRYRNRPTERFLLSEQMKNPVDDISAKIAGEHSEQWFQELMTDRDIDRCFDYITKSYRQQNSDMLAVTYS